MKYYSGKKKTKNIEFISKTIKHTGSQLQHLFKVILDREIEGKFMSLILKTKRNLLLVEKIEIIQNDELKKKERECAMFWSTEKRRI